MELIKEIGAFAGLVAFLGLAVLALLSFAQARDVRRLREWAGSAPERDGERKESTSEAAAERAEEMRRLEEAREAEQRAAELREERRQRREAGLPELTRAERLRERFAGGRVRLGEPRYLVAIGIVTVLVGAGAVFAATGGFDGGEGKGKGRGGKSGAATLRPSEIEVTVLNGTAVPGLAATYAEMVERGGFGLGAVTNSPSSFGASVVMYQRGRAREARRVAGALGISRLRPMTSDIGTISAGAPVSVIVGEDNASSAP